MTSLLHYFIGNISLISMFLSPTAIAVKQNHVIVPAFLSHCRYHSTECKLPRPSHHFLTATNKNPDHLYRCLNTQEKSNNRILNYSPYGRKNAIRNCIKSFSFSSLSSSSSLFLSNEEETNEESYTTPNQSKSTARSGGRSKFSSMKKNDKSPDTSTSSLIIMNVVKKALPFLISFTILKGIFGLLFGGIGGGANYVYYQSTVYESRSYNDQGEMKTVRKESVKSNAPSLINGNRDDNDSKSFLIRDISDEEFDQELDQVIRRSMSANYF